MSEITNAELSNQYSGCFRVTVIGENKVTGLANIYSTLVSLPDAITVDCGPILGKTRENSKVMNCFGNLAGYTKGVVTIADKTLDITYGMDYVYSSDNAKFVETCKNALQACFEGTSFQLEISTNVFQTVKIIGTNGCRKVATVETFQDFMYLLYRDMKLIEPGSDDGTGKPILKDNTVINAYDDVVTIMVEMLHASGPKKQGIRIACMSFDNPSFAEGTDINKVTLNGMRLCDVMAIDKYFIEGNTVSDVPTYSTTVSTASYTDTLVGITAALGIGTSVYVTSDTLSTLLVDGTVYYVLAADALALTPTGSGETIVTGQTVAVAYSTSTATITTGIVADLTSNLLIKTAHGFPNGKVLTCAFADASGLTAGVVYYVINATTDTFKVSTSLGGGEFNITIDADNVIFLYDDTPITINAINVDYLIVAALAVAPTISSTLGKTCAVIDITAPTAPVVRLWVCTGTTNWSQTADTFALGTKIFSKTYATAATYSGFLTQNVYAVVNESSVYTSGSAIPVSTKTMSTGNGTSDYLFKAYDFVFDTATFTAYAS